MTARGGARLLLIGASVRALAQSAARSRLAARFYPGDIIALDYFGDLDLLAIPGVSGLSIRRDLGRPRTAAALCRAAAGLEWDACVFAGGLENHPALLRRLARDGALLGNEPEAVRSVRDPAALFACLRRAGIPHPATPGRGAGALSPRRGAFLWKPRRSGGGGRLRRALPGERRPRGFYLQGYVTGRVGSVAIASAGSGAVEILGVSEQLVGVRALGGSGYRYGGNIAGPPGAFLPPHGLRLLERAVRAIALRFGLRGLNGVDFIVTADGIPRILEVNPRWTASMELFEEIRGESLFDRHLIASGRGSKARPALRAPAPAPFLAKGILYADRPIRGADPGRLVALGCRDIPVPGERIEAGQPVLTVVAAGTSREACLRALLDRAAETRAALAAGPVVRSSLRASGAPPRRVPRRIAPRVLC